MRNARPGDGAGVQRSNPEAGAVPTHSTASEHAAYYSDTAVRKSTDTRATCETPSDLATDAVYQTAKPAARFGDVQFPECRPNGLFAVTISSRRGLL